MRAAIGRTRAKMLALALAVGLACWLALVGRPDGTKSVDQHAQKPPAQPVTEFTIIANPFRLLTSIHTPSLTEEAGLIREGAPPAETANDVSISPDRSPGSSRTGSDCTMPGAEPDPACAPTAGGDARELLEVTSEELRAASDPIRRIHLVRRLSLISDGGALDVLFEHVSDPSPEVRAAVVQALGTKLRHSPSPTVQAYLEAATQDSDSDVATLAANLIAAARNGEPASADPSLAPSETPPPSVPTRSPPHSPPPAPGGLSSDAMVPPPSPDVTQGS